MHPLDARNICASLVSAPVSASAGGCHPLRALAFITALVASAGSAPAGGDYSLTVVDAFVSTSTRETQLWGINEQGTGCGNTDMATIDNGNTSITTTGFIWRAEDGKSPVPIRGPHGINNYGVLAGFNAVHDLRTGVTTTMPGLSGNPLASVLLGINDSGVAVGYIPTCSCSNSQGRQQIPYVWSAAAGARTLAVLGATGAGRINNAGLVVGWIGGRAATDGFVYNLSNDQYFLVSSLFPPMNNGYTAHGTADDISENNLVTGTRLSPDALVTQGYTWRVGDSAPTLLPTPPAGYAPDVRPAGINSLGTVVGTIALADGGNRAFVYDAAHGIRDLNSLVVSPGFTLLGAYQVNDHGWIVGYGQGGGGLYKAFVLTPQTPPCPADYNHSGVVGVQDLFDFLTDWFAPRPAADFNNSAAVTVQDIFDFLTAWFTPCP